MSVPSGWAVNSAVPPTLPLAMARLWVEVAPFSSTSVRSTRTRPMSGAHQLSSVPLIVTGALRRDEGEIVRVITVRKRAASGEPRGSATVSKPTSCWLSSKRKLSTMPSPSASSPQLPWRTALRVPPTG